MKKQIMGLLICVLHGLLIFYVGEALILLAELRF